MTYFGRPALSGCGCGCKGSGACGPMGDDASSIGKAVGAPKGVNPALYLRAQLNRFTAAGGAPFAFQYATTPLPLTSSLDAETASRALFVLNMRAGYAQTILPDPATKAILATYASAWKNPLAYVTENLAAVTDVVRLFADSQRIPAAVGVPKYIKVPIVGDLPESTVLVGGIALAAAIYFGRRRR